MSSISQINSVYYVMRLNISDLLHIVSLLFLLRLCYSFTIPRFETRILRQIVDNIVAEMYYYYLSPSWFNHSQFCLCVYLQVSYNLTHSSYERIPRTRPANYSQLNSLFLQIVSDAYPSELPWLHCSSQAICLDLLTVL